LFIIEKELEMYHELYERKELEGSFAKEIGKARGKATTHIFIHFHD